LDSVTHELLQGDAFEILRELASRRRRFDLVILDPPSFAMKQSDRDGALSVYRRLNALGAALVSALEARLSRIETLRQQIQTRAASAPERHSSRLRQRIHDLGVDVDPTRLAQEVALLAERLDVSEELDRLAAHIARFRALMRESAPGRELEFLCQELLREANTTGSKCQDAEIAHLVVELKAEIERAREQVQNVE
jgi:uncharacterized protein (TIGR00255 family)